VNAILESNKLGIPLKEVNDKIDQYLFMMDPIDREVTEYYYQNRPKWKSRDCCEFQLMAIACATKILIEYKPTADKRDYAMKMGSLQKFWEKQLRRLKR